MKINYKLSLNLKKMKVFLILLLSIVFFSCNKEDILLNNKRSLNVVYRLNPGVDFKTKKSGEWSDTSIWMRNNGVEWIDAHDTPDSTNSVFLESNYFVQLDSNESCKDFNLNGNQDTIRIKTNNNILNVYGKMRTYTGLAPGVSAVGSEGAGVDGWISGNIKFKGSSNRVIIENEEISANSRCSGWNMIISFDYGDTAKVNNIVRCGHLIVESGVLHIQGVSEGLSNNYEIRTSGDDYTAQPGNGISGGTVLVKSGATLIGTRFRKNSPLTIGNSLASFTIENGAFFIPKGPSPSIATLSYSFLGKVIYNRNGNQDFLVHLGNIDAVPIITYENLELSGSGAKRLKNNVSVVDSYSLISPATLNSNGFTLTNP